MHFIFLIALLSSAADPKCDASLLKHVYNPDRLHVIEPCVTITGKVQEIRREHDGDEHTLLKLDPQFKHMLNDKNKSNQKGDLVIEPMCNKKPKQKDTLDSRVCRRFKQTFPALKPGACVEVTGVYVLDAEHGHNEIHPVTSVKQIPCKE